MDKSFEQDWADAEKLVDKKKASATRKTEPMPSLPVRTGVRPVHMAGEIHVSGARKHVNHLKKIKSDNAKAQPRAGGKFSKEPGFFTRIGWIITGKGRKMVNASIRAEQKRNRAASRPSIPTVKKSTRERKAR